MYNELHGTNPSGIHAADANKEETNKMQLEKKNDMF